MEFNAWRILQEISSATTSAHDHSSSTVASPHEDKSHPNINRTVSHWDLLKYLGDFCHLLSFAILIYNMKKKKNCLGVSYRTQEIYLIVFLARYCDLFFAPQPNLWNVFCKVLYITLTVYCIYLIRFERPICVSYETVMDKFPHRIALIPAAFLLGMLLPDYSLWAFFHPVFHRVYNFTVVLEAFAILPQLALLRKIREIEIVTGGYIFCLGIYRGIYILSWIWRIVEMNVYFKSCYIKFIFGVIQFLLYGDFIVNYIKSVREKKPFVSLPI
jgi:ER lumen protein retaining receptor